LRRWPNPVENHACQCHEQQHDDKTDDTKGSEGCRQKITKKPIRGRTTDGSNDNIAGLNQLGCNMQHPVVTGMQQHCDCTT
jgi:hypothetical protein